MFEMVSDWKLITDDIQERFKTRETGIVCLIGDENPDMKRFVDSICSVFMESLDCDWSKVPIVVIDFLNYQIYHSEEEVLEEIRFRLEGDAGFGTDGNVMKTLLEREEFTLLILQNLDKTDPKLLELIYERVISRLRKEPGNLFLLITTTVMLPFFNKLKFYQLPEKVEVVQDFNGLPDLFGSEAERDFYALLAIPAWFDENLARKLTDQFKPGAFDLFYQTLDNSAHVFAYERRGLHFNTDFRAFLLSKAQELFGAGTAEIHLFLADYYLDGTDAASPIVQRETTYLSLYHRLRAQPQAALDDILMLLEATKKLDLLPVLTSLMLILDDAGEVDGLCDGVREFIQLFVSAFRNTEQRKILKEVVTRVKDIEASLDEEKDRLFLLSVYRLQLYLHPFVNANHKQEKKLEEKIKRKLKRLRDSKETVFEPRAARSHFKRKDYRKSNRIQEVIDRIVGFHQAGKHEEAAGEMVALTHAHDGQKDMMCRSFCSIAGSLKEFNCDPLIINGYIERAIKSNRFDPTALSLKGVYLKESGDVQGALAVFEEVFALDPKNQIALSAKAELLGEKKTD